MKLKFFIILCLFYTNNAFSQAYIPFQFGNTQWAYKEIFFQNVTPYFYFSKDTISINVNGNKYWKIERKSNPNYSPSTSNLYLFDDTIARKVYVYNTNTTTNNLLYDFSANVGDTISSIYNYPSNGFNDIIIDSIKLISSNSILRKHFYLHIVNSIISKIWIEGIGSTYDLFMPSTTLPDPEFYLNCYQYNGSTMFPDTLIGQDLCKNVMTKSTDFDWRTTFSIYPNPASDFLQVSSHTNAALIHYKIYNNIGKVVCDSATKNCRIEISNLALGNYFLQLQTKEAFQTVKFLKE